MKINKITIYFEKKTIVLPSKGNFSAGLNIIYSKKNNKGKTTIIRSIFKAFFSSTIQLPSANPTIGTVNKIVIEVIHNSKFITVTNNFKTDTISISEAGFESTFSTRTELLQYFFPKFPYDNQVRPSVIGSSLLMDQDYWSTDASLWPAMWQYRDQVKLARYWLYSGADNISFEKHNSFVSEIRKQIKVVKRKISFFKDKENDITGLKSLDISEMEEKINKSKLAKKEYKNIYRQIKTNNVKIANLGFMTKKQNKFTRDKMFYISAFDIKTNEPIQVKVDMQRLFNFSNTPLNEISKDANIEIKELELANVSLRSRLDAKAAIIINDGVGDLTSLDLSELEKDLNVLKGKLSSAIKLKSDFNNLQKEIKKDIKEMNTFISEESSRIKKKFSEFDSESGSDKFVSKVSNYIAFVKNIKAINFPIFIDSFKEKDFAVENQETLLKYMDSFLLANEKQVFMSATSPKLSIIKKYKSHIIE